MTSSKKTHPKKTATRIGPKNDGNKNKGAEQQFQQRLTALIEVGNLLSREKTFDNLCRRAVELGRSRLGFDRLGIWFLTNDPTVAIGSFGTNKQGQIIDERHQRETKIDPKMIDSVKKKEKTLWRHDGEITSIERKPLGTGTNVAATIWDGEDVIGYLNMDNLIHHRPITEHDCELIELYASTLGHLCSRQRTQEALAEQRFLLRTLLDNLPGFIYVKDTESRFVVANQATVERCGAELLEDIIGKTDHDLPNFQDNADEYRDEEIQIMQTGQSMLNKEQLRYDDDNKKWFSSNKIPWRDSHGKIVGLVGINYDITEMKNTENRLRESEERLRLTFEQAPIGLTTYDMNGLYLSANPAFCKIVGYTAGELLKMSVMDITHPEDMDSTAENIRKFREGETDYGRYEKKYLRKNGTAIVVNVHVGMVRDLRGRPMYLVAQIEDITERKQAEEALKESEERFRSLVETTSDWIWALDQDTRYTYASPAIKNLLGYEPEEVIGKKPFDLMPPEEAQRIVGEFASIVKTHKPFKGLVNTNLHKDGRRVEMETSGVPIFDANGEFQGYRGIDRDITERKRAEEDLLNREEAERKFQQQLMNLLDMSIQLSKIESFDDFYREAVEQSRKQLGFERVGIWFYSKEQPGTVVGTFGTDDNGQTRDERDMRASIDSIEQDMLTFGDSVYPWKDDEIKTLRMRKEFDNEEQCEVAIRNFSDPEFLLVALVADKPFYDSARRYIGTGTLVRATIWDGQEIVGYTTMDNKIHRQPITDHDCELLALFASILGHLRSRTLAVNALRESERTLKAITDSAMDAIIMMDQTGKISFWNPAAEKTFGYSAEEITGKDLHMVLAPESYHEDYRKGFAHFAQTGEGPVLGKTLEVAAKHKDGTEFPIELTVSHPVPIEGEKYMAGVIRDITERKRAEEEVRRARDELEIRVRERTAELTEANEHLRLTQFSIDHTAESAFWIGPDAKLLYVNESACQQLGYSRDELLNMTVHDLDPDFPTEIWPDHWRELKEHGSFSFESRHKTKDGKTFPVEVTANYVEFNEREYNFAFARDITERRQLQRQLMQSQKLESIGTLAGGIAHDFNNLLAVIMGQVSVHQRDKTLPEKISDSFADIMDATERGSSLTNQLLTYARGGLQNPVATDLNEIIRSVLQMLRRTSPPQIELVMNLKKGLPPVVVDPTQIEQVLMNLCLNAIQASQAPGSINVKSSLETLSAKRSKLLDLDKGRYICIRVEDQGCGMDTDTQERIFEPFYSTKTMGRGMGLPTSLGIVRSHNGQIQVDSTPGGGTTVSVWLPPAGKEVVVRATPPEVKWEEPPKGSETILVIDDDQAVSRTVEKMLNQLGYIVIAHNDADDATAFMDTNSEDINLVILNLNIPKCSSKEMLARIAKRCPHAPILLASGFDSQATTEQLSQKGVAGFIQKPFSMLTLAQAIRQALDETAKSMKHSTK